MKDLKDMPFVHRNFDQTRVLKEPALSPLGFAPVGELSFVSEWSAGSPWRPLEINFTDQVAAEQESSIYAFVVDDEVVRMGHGKGSLRVRMRGWEGTMAEALCLKALLDEFSVGRIFAKLGSKNEEHDLLKNHLPRMNRSTR